jgi:serine/threonine-protein kinase HipA
MVAVLDVLLNEIPVGQLTLLPGDQTLFHFSETYINRTQRPILSQSFLDRMGQLILNQKPTYVKAPPFFSNLLPEGYLRDYIAAKAHLKPQREFPLLALLGEDLPGAVQIRPLSGLPLTQHLPIPETNDLNYWRFSLAGVQLKFSAIMHSTDKVTIPSKGLGGSWIIKLPSARFHHVPENEFAMMTLAREIGIPIPDIKLITLDAIEGLPDLPYPATGTALAVRRFDRCEEGKRIHMEDFAQVFGVFPEEKYEKVSYTNIAQMLWQLTGEQGLTDFIRRLVFNAMIGNADMHLKNWSLLYLDGKTPSLAPAYDLVSTIVYLPDSNMSLSLVGIKEMKQYSLALFRKLAQKAKLPEKLVLATAQETSENLREAWHKLHKYFSLPHSMIMQLEHHMAQVFQSKSN